MLLAFRQLSAVGCGSLQVLGLQDEHSHPFESFALLLILLSSELLRLTQQQFLLSRRAMASGCDEIFVFQKEPELWFRS